MIFVTGFLRQEQFENHSISHHPIDVLFPHPILHTCQMHANPASPNSAGGKRHSGRSRLPTGTRAFNPPLTLNPTMVYMAEVARASQVSSQMKQYQPATAPVNSGNRVCRYAMGQIISGSSIRDIFHLCLQEQDDRRVSPTPIFTPYYCILCILTTPARAAVARAAHQRGQYRVLPRHSDSQHQAAAGGRRGDRVGRRRSGRGRRCQEDGDGGRGRPCRRQPPAGRAAVHAAAETSVCRSRRRGVFVVVVVEQAPAPFVAVDDGVARAVVECWHARAQVADADAGRWSPRYEDTA